METSRKPFRNPIKRLFSAKRKYTFFVDQCTLVVSEARGEDVVHGCSRQDHGCSLLVYETRGDVVDGSSEHGAGEVFADDVVDGPEGCVVIVKVSSNPLAIIKHAHSRVALRAIGDDRLSFGNLQDNDKSFQFTYSVISGLFNCGAGQQVIIMAFTTSTSASSYVVGDHKQNDANLKSLEPLSRSAETLDVTDPRFFIHHYITHSCSLLESLKHRGYFLALDSERTSLVLRKMTNKENKDFHFSIKAGENRVEN